MEVAAPSVGGGGFVVEVELGRSEAGAVADDASVRARGDGHGGTKGDRHREDEAVVVIGVFADEVDPTGRDTGERRRRAEAVGVHRDGNVDSGHRATLILDEACLDWDRAEMSSVCAHNRAQRPLSTLARGVAAVPGPFVSAGEGWPCCTL